MATANTTQEEWYTINSGIHQYTLPARYQHPKVIGHGAFGAVIRARDTETGKYVAIKKMLAPFQTSIHAKRTYRELKLLTYLNHPDAQVVQLLNVFTPENNVNEFQTLYFVLNYSQYDLSRLIRRKIPFTEELIKQIIYSLLRGLKFIHSAGIIHRDIKPPNIGIDEGSNAIILDFGLARTGSGDGQTTYVASRWWRAPEVYINKKQYREKLDIWSIGCIMAEMIRLQPIFAGADALDQLNKIFDILGTPDPTTLNEICTPNMCTFINGLPIKTKKDFNELFGYKYSTASETPISGVSPEGIDLLDRLLSFDPRARPTAEEALTHPFLDPYHDPMEEPTTEPLFDEHEDEKHSVLEWKEIIWQMVEEFLPPSWVTDDLAEDS